LRAKDFIATRTPIVRVEMRDQGRRLTEAGWRTGLSADRLPEDAEPQYKALLSET